MTTNDIDAIRARAGKATRGPWVARPYMPERRDDIEVEPPLNPEPEYALETAWTHPQLKAPQSIACIAVGVWYWDRIHWMNPDDAAFIAAARTDVPLLCDEVEALRGELARAREVNRILWLAIRDIAHHDGLDTDDMQQTAKQALQDVAAAFVGDAGRGEGK